MASSDDDTLPTPVEDKHLPHDYDALTPDTVLDAVESVGLVVDARILALNSYENRVYQVGIDEQEPVIVKFYRPNRWTDEAILEEHSYSDMLAEHEIPVIAPSKNEEGKSLHTYNGYRFALFPRKGGYAPEVGDLDQLSWLGRLMGRIHAVGSTAPFTARPTLDVNTYCREPSKYLLEHDFIPGNYVDEYRAITTDIADTAVEIINSVNNLKWIRCHGDCHVGNILWQRDHGPHFVDFDDCQTAPAIQDLWMLLAGDRQEKTIQLSEILDQYTEYFEFNAAEIKLIEPLRALRMVHYAGWLARRWTDPAFPMYFTWFNTSQYWMQHLGEIREQLVQMTKEPLRWF
ncbi:MAG: serine/threonine protein kinase [Pseudomonadales bacterium]|nr:serine/threonine protein kinase [Pseudomonadales bacterium]